MRYAKGHGKGNDFIIVPDLDDQLELGADVVRRLCDRHEGIGADGVLRVVSRSSDPAPWFMDYRNADGSIAEMCGNGIRVFARYLLDHGMAAGPGLAIATRTRARAGSAWSVLGSPGSTRSKCGSTSAGRGRRCPAVRVRWLRRWLPRRRPGAGRGMGQGAGGRWMFPAEG